jgi:hypothetical protein
MTPKKNKPSLPYLLIFVIYFFSSCQKEIDVKIPDYEQKLVVDGTIEPGEKPVVILTWTAPYFGNQNYSNFQQYFVENAEVIVSDGSASDTLYQPLPGVFPAYTSTNLIGQIGKTYTLTIIVNNQTYTAVTTILPAIPLDSLYFKPDLNDTLGFLWAHFKDPEVPGDFYRWFAKRINKDDRFLAPFGSATDDKFFNGKEFDFPNARGMEPNSQNPDDKSDERGYFKKGDSVMVKFCTIGEKEYRYFRSYYQNLSSNGNPFSAPSTLESNISNGAIGLWCGYGTFFKGVRLQ